MADRFIIEYSGTGSMRCTRCGGYSVNTLGNGQAQCTECGLTAVPTAPNPYRGWGRVILVLVTVLAGVSVADIAIALLIAGGLTPSFPHDAALALFWTGIAVLMVAGVFGASSTLSLRTIGGISLRDEGRRRGESFASFVPVMVTAGFGFALTAFGLLIGV